VQSAKLWFSFSLEPWLPTEPSIVLHRLHDQKIKPLWIYFAVHKTFCRSY
jgi:hypothetical protein